MVAIVNNKTSRDKEVVHLVRYLVFVAAKFQFRLHATHIPGIQNTVADALSRDNMPLFRSLLP